MTKHIILKRVTAVVGIILLTISICLFLYSYDNKYTAPTPRGLDGYMYLTEADTEQVNFLISGWAVYGGTLLNPEAILLNNLVPDDYIFIGQYGGFENLSGSPHGSVTYRLNIGIPKRARIYMLALPEIYSSFRIYINGEELYSLGETEPEFFRFETGNVLIPFEAAGEIDLIIAVSDYRHFYSGIVHPPALGTPDTILRFVNQRTYLRLMICAAALVVGITSLLVGFMSKYKGIAVLYGLLCLFFIAYTAYPVTMTLFRGKPFYYTVEMFSFCALLLVVMLLQGRIPPETLPYSGASRRMLRILQSLIHSGGNGFSRLWPFMICFGVLVCLAALLIPFATAASNLSLMGSYSILINIY